MQIQLSLNKPVKIRHFPEKFQFYYFENHETLVEKLSMTSICSGNLINATPRLAFAFSYLTDYYVVQWSVITEYWIFNINMKNPGDFLTFSLIFQQEK